MYDTILVPTDGSAGTDKTLDHAIPIAREFDATIHVVYVVDSRMSTVVGTDVRDDVMESLQRDGQRAIARVTDRLDTAGVPYETEIRNAHPHRGILFSAEEHDVDLIVMGTRGRGQASQRGSSGMGSVTQRVLDSEQWPVLAVNIRR